MLTSDYIKDHLKFIPNLKPEFGQTIARAILEKAILEIGNRSTEEIKVSLEFGVTEVKAEQCVEILVNGVHVGHIGV